MGGFAIAEKFLSFQGEGIHSGRRAYFIRLFGCNVKCGWCDSKSAWEGAASETLSAREIADAAMLSGAEIAVVTGGEPCLYDLRPLLRELSARSISAHLETSGTLPIPEGCGRISRGSRSARSCFARRARTRSRGRTSSNS